MLGKKVEWRRWMSGGGDGVEEREREAEAALLHVGLRHAPCYLSAPGPTYMPSHNASSESLS